MLDFNNSFFASKSPPPSSLGFPRAQNFSTVKLQSKQDAENARVSLNQALRLSRPAVTSASHLGPDSGSAAVSVNRAGQYDESADEQRWNYVRRLVKERQTKETAAAAAAAKDEPDVYAVKGAGTGSGFARKFSFGLNRRLYRQMKKAPATYKNISAKDRQYFLDVLEPHAKVVRAGVGFNRLARKKMKREIEGGWRQGRISREDAKDMKKMVDNLPH